MKKNKLITRVKIQFKSGQVVELKADDKLIVNMTGERIVNFKWDRTVPRLMFICLPAIEAITCVPLKWYERIL